MKAERPGARDATIATGARPPGSIQRMVRRQTITRFTPEQAHTMWWLLDATMCAQEDRREIAKWRRLRDKFRLPPNLNKSMTKEQAIEELKKAQANDDTECAHVHADDVLRKLLTALGYADVVAEYQKVGKWYA